MATRQEQTQAQAQVIADPFAELVKSAVRTVLAEYRDELKTVPMRSRLLTVADAAKYLSASEVHVRNLIAMGILTGIRWPTAPGANDPDTVARNKMWLDWRELDAKIDEIKAQLARAK